MNHKEQSENSAGGHKIRLPRLLKVYLDRDYPEQIKARLIYYIYITAITSTLLALLLTYANNSAMGFPSATLLLKLISESITTVVLSFFFFSFLKGRYTLSAISVIVILQLQIWFLMYLENQSVTSLYRIFVHLLAVNAVTPILSKNEGKTIIVFLLSNIFLLYITAFHVHADLFTSLPEQLLFFATTTISIIFVAVIGVNIFSINKLSLLYVGEKLELHKIMEAELANSEKKYREMADLLPQSIFELRNDGTLSYINKNGLKMIGYKKEEVDSNFNFINIIAPEDRELMVENVRKFFITGRNSSHIYMGIRKDGKRFPVRFSSSIIQEDGVVTGLRGIGIDISEEREAEEAMRDTLQLFRTIIEFDPLPIMLYNSKGHILMINNAFKKVTGYSYSDITRDDGIRLKDLIPPDALADINTKLEKSGIVENVEVRTYKKNSKGLDILFYCKNISIKGKQVSLSTFIDNTEMKRNELELEYYRDDLERLVLERTEELAVSNDELQIANNILSQQRKELQKAIEELRNTEKQLFIADKMASLGMLAAGIAHEINNPLNFIKGGIYGLESFFHDNLPAEKQEEAMPLIIAIDRGIDRAADIVKSLNRFNRQTDNRTEECDLHAIIDDCLILLDNQLKNRIEVVKRFEAQQHTFYYNQGRINQAMINLLANAAQAIDGEGKITIITSNQNNSLILSIVDTGSGIDEKYMNHIFNPFFTTKEPGKGTGLGLSITFQIVKEMDGEIEYNSMPGEGTTVTVRIPLKLNKNE